MKLLIAVCLIAVAVAQHHPPHPECHQDSDCTNTCHHNMVAVCTNHHQCDCAHPVAKRADACTTPADCTCTTGTAACNPNGHCHCNGCMTDADCPACDAGKVASCNHHNHCHCKHP